MHVNSSIYTIGYATKPIAVFIQQLQQYNINVVADVRSVPYSKIFHDYHKESIAFYLKQQEIAYVYLGDELGPRSKDDNHYDDTQQVLFDRLMQSSLFEQGVQRLAKGVKKSYNIALMCAEKDPATCHRSLLIGYFLARQGLDKQALNCDILHITHDGHIETQNILEQRLCHIHGVEEDLFLSKDERAMQAYQLQLKKTSYRKP